MTVRDIVRVPFNGIQGIASGRRVRSSKFFSGGLRTFFNATAFAAYTAGPAVLATPANLTTQGFANAGTNGTVTDASGNFASASGANRLTYAAGSASGLLCEEARTNGIRNNTMAGAAAGTPGTMPNNWPAVNNAGALSVTLATGTERGQPYLDVRLSGTTSTTQTVVYFESDITIAAGTSQARTLGVDAKLAAGALTNVGTVELGFIEQDGVGGFVTTGSTAFTPSGTYQTALHQRTTSAASTAFVKPFVSFNFASGVAIDLTLRIQLPQDDGAATWASSKILTSSAAVTRTIDQHSITSAVLTNAAGTVVIGWVPFNSGSATKQTLFRRGTGEIYVQSGQVFATDGTNTITIGAVTNGATNRVAVTWGGGALRGSIGGAAAVSGSFTGSFGSGNTLNIGHNAGATSANARLLDLGLAGKTATAAQVAQISGATL